LSENASHICGNPASVRYIAHRWRCRHSWMVRSQDACVRVLFTNVLQSVYAQTVKRVKVRLA